MELRRRIFGQGGYGFQVLKRAEMGENVSVACVLSRGLSGDDG